MKLSIITVVMSLFTMTVLSGCSYNASVQNVADAEIKDQELSDEKEKDGSVDVPGKRGEASFVKEKPEKDKPEITETKTEKKLQGCICR